MLVSGACSGGSFVKIGAPVCSYILVPSPSFVVSPDRRRTGELEGGESLGAGKKRIMMLLFLGNIELCASSWTGLDQGFFYLPSS